jgi:hypothetical protein
MVIGDWVQEVAGNVQASGWIENGTRHCELWNGKECVFGCGNGKVFLKEYFSETCGKHCLKQWPSSLSLAAFPHLQSAVNSIHSVGCFLE